MIKGEFKLTLLGKLWVSVYVFDMDVWFLSFTLTREQLTCSKGRETKTEADLLQGYQNQFDTGFLRGYFLTEFALLKISTSIKMLTI